MGKLVVDESAVKVKWPRYRKSNSLYLLKNSRFCLTVGFAKV